MPEEVEAAQLKGEIGYFESSLKNIAAWLDAIHQLPAG